MKKLLVCIIFIAFLVQLCPAAFTTSIDTPSTYKNAYRWTGQPGADKILLWAQEVEDSLDGTMALTQSVYTATDSPTGTTAGTLYYDLSLGKFVYRNGSGAWVTIEAGAVGNSLDGAYDAGKTITADDGTVAITATAGAANVVLALTQSATGATVGQTITSAGTGALLSLDSNGTGADILGSDSTWTVTKAGAGTFVGLTTTSDLLFNGAAYDVAFDASRNALVIESDAYLGIGASTHDDAADWTLSYNDTDLVMESLAANDLYALGKTTNFDVGIYAQTATNYVLFDTDDTASEVLIKGFDVSLGDGDQLLFGNTLGTGDFSISDESDVLLITQVADATGSVAFSADGEGMDVKFFTDTASSYILIDENGQTNGSMVFEATDLHMMDGDNIFLGDSIDFSITATNQACTLQTLTTNGSSAWNFGADTDGSDIKMFGETTAEYLLWDASEDYLHGDLGNVLFTTNDAEADQFKVNATGTIADGGGDAIVLETTNGGIMLNADTAANGDIELNAADDVLIVAAAAVTVTNTEAMTVSGALTVSGVSTNASAMVASGIQDVAAGGTTTALTVATKSVFTVGADAGGDIMTIANGTAGQVIYVICEDATGTVTVTPSTFGGGTSITFDAVGDAVTLVYTAGTGWNVVGGNSYTII